MAASRTRKARASRRRQRRMARGEHDLTPEHWVALQDAWGRCAYCGADDVAFQRDCVLPISRGGRYTLDNVVPACRSCNASKCNDEVTGWMRRRKLDERTFLLRQFEIRTELAARFATDVADEEEDADPDAAAEHDGVERDGGDHDRLDGGGLTEPWSDR